MSISPTIFFDPIYPNRPLSKTSKTPQTPNHNLSFSTNSTIFPFYQTDPKPQPTIYVRQSKVSMASHFSTSSIKTNYHVHLYPITISTVAHSNSTIDFDTSSVPI